MPINFEQLTNATFTLVFWFTANGEEKVKVYRKQAIWLPDINSVSIHDIGMERPLMLLEGAALSRILKVPDEKTREILLGAEYYVNVYMDDLPDAPQGE